MSFYNLLKNNPCVMEKVVVSYKYKIRINPLSIYFVVA